MRILITGNMGYIGPSVVRRLRDTYPHATLIGLDTGYFAHCLTGANMLPEARLDMQYFADVRAIPDATLKEVDVIVHLAAISNDPMGNTFEEVTFDVNHRASAALARKAKAEGVKTFVFASSCSMTYGEAVNAEEMCAQRYLPEGLVEGCKLKRAIPKDQPLTYDDVELPKGRVADRLRAEQYRHFRGDPWLELHLNSSHDDTLIESPAYV